MGGQLEASTSSRDESPEAFWTGGPAALARAARPGPGRGLGHLLGRCLKETRTIPAGALLFHSGSTCTSLYSIVSGEFEAIQDLPEGGRRVLAFFYSGDLLLPASPGELWPYALRALSQGQVETYPVEVLRKACANDGALAFGLFEAACRTLSSRLEQGAALRVHSVDRRFAQFLLEAARWIGAERGGGLVLTLPMSRTDIASYLGLRSETLSRVIRRWREQGLIELERSRRLLVRDVRRLEAIARDPLSGLET